ncbi:hypothetical protein D3C72_1916510 [compost metagenome]
MVDRSLGPADDGVVPVVEEIVVAGNGGHVGMLGHDPERIETVIDGAPQRIVLARPRIGRVQPGGIGIGAGIDQDLRNVAGKFEIGVVHGIELDGGVGAQGSSTGLTHSPCFCSATARLMSARG